MATERKAFATYADIETWPEWQAFKRRLGVAVSVASRTLDIHLDYDGETIITHQYLGEDTGPQ